MEDTKKRGEKTMKKTIALLLIVCLALTTSISGCTTGEQVTNPEEASEAIKDIGQGVEDVGDILEDIDSTLE